LFIIVAPLTSGFFKQLVTAANFPVCQRIAWQCRHPSRLSGDLFGRFLYRRL